MRPVSVPQEPEPEEFPRRQTAEVELVSLLRLVRKYSLILAIGCLLAASIGYAASFLFKPVYEATTTLLTKESKFGEDVERDLFPIETFRGLIKSQAGLMECMEQFNLRSSPYEFTYRRMDKAVTVEAVRGTKLLRAQVRLPDRELAPRIANFLSERAVERNEELRRSELLGSTDFLEGQVRDALTALSETGENLSKTRQAARVEQLRKELEIQLYVRGDLTARLARSQADLEEATARTAYLREELQDSSETVRLSTDVRLGSLPRDVISKTLGVEDTALDEIATQGETLNPAHTQLEIDFRAQSARVRGLESETNHITGVLQDNEKLVKRLEASLADQELAVDEATALYQSAKEQYQTLQTTLAQSQVRISSRSPQLVVLDAAVPPERPVSPRRGLVAALAGLSGLIALSLVLLTREYWMRNSLSPSGAARDDSTSARLGPDI